MDKRIKLIRHGEFVRIDVSDHADIKTVIEEINRHVDGVEWCGSQYDNSTFEVDGEIYETKADAILAMLSFDEEFETEFNLIESAVRNDYKIGCSRIENDTKNERTDRTHHSNKSAYEIVEILAIQPYIHRFSQNMGEELEDAFKILSKEIVKAQNLNKGVFVPQF